MARRTHNIIGYRRAWYLLSGGLLLLSLLAVAAWGLRFGIDFTGGSLVEVTFTDERPVSAALAASLPEELGHTSITPVGERGYILRLRSLDEVEHQRLLAALREGWPTDDAEKGVREERFTSIGPVVGTELKRKSVWSIVMVLTAIVIYIAWAFRKVSKPVPSWQYGLAAIVALFHDVFLPIGIFAALGRFLGVEVDTLFITALLTVLGFSVHDTIVVFDRIREHLPRSTESFATIVNRSVNETIVRSINTSLTALIVLLTTLVFGGETIRYFVLTLVLGITFGTYSSIFIASPLLVSWHSWSEKRRRSSSRP